MIDSIKEGGEMGLAIGGIIYAIVVVLRISTDQCSIVVQEIIFMVVGGGIGWAVGSGFDIMGISFTSVFGLIVGALLGALLKILTDSKSG